MDGNNDRRRAPGALLAALVMGLAGLALAATGVAEQALGLVMDVDGGGPRRAGDAASVELTGSDQSAAAHEDGNGCDDVLFAEGDPPFGIQGGPAGCDVGNSGENRSNGQVKDEGDAPDGEGAEGAREPKVKKPKTGAGQDPEGEDAEGQGSEQSVAAHTNGHGCDDVLFAGGDPPFSARGGPVGCEVGNSGENRKNGQNVAGADGGGEAGGAGAGQKPKKDKPG